MLFLTIGLKSQNLVNTKSTHKIKYKYNLIYCSLLQNFLLHFMKYLCFMFPQLILMRRGGELIYTGPTGKHSSKVIEYFEASLYQTQTLLFDPLLFLHKTNSQWFSFQEQRIH